MKGMRIKMLEELINRYPELNECKANIISARDLLTECFENGGKLLVCGNGGSCADSDHIVGELMKGFLLKRKIPDTTRQRLAVYSDGEYLAENLQGALPAISLCAHAGLVSAYANDVKADMVYAQQVYGYADKGDVLIGITTSGNSANVVNAAKVAKVCGMKVVGLTGKKNNLLDGIADTVIHVPETETFKVQELHLPVYHYLCAACEMKFFSDSNN